MLSYYSVLFLRVITFLVAGSCCLWTLPSFYKFSRGIQWGYTLHRSVLFLVALGTGSFQGIRLLWPYRTGPIYTFMALVPLCVGLMLSIYGMWRTRKRPLNFDNISLHADVVMAMVDLANLDRNAAEALATEARAASAVILVRGHL